MKLKKINNVLIKSFLLFISFFIKTTSLADAVADNSEVLLIPSLTQLNEANPTYYPRRSSYGLNQGDSSNFIITKYLTSTNSDGQKEYTPLSFNLDVDDIIIDSTGSNYIYYKWEDSSVGNRILSITDMDSADFYVKYAGITSLSSYLSSLDNIVEGDFYYVYNEGKFEFSTSIANAVYAINYDSSYATISIDSDGFITIDINDIDDSACHSYVYNYKGAAIESIDGNFYEASTSARFGGAIYSYYSSIGEIEGNFIGNYAKYLSGNAYGGAIYNYYTNEIGDITGDFVGNYAYSQTGDAKGGAIYNYYKVATGNITGDFIGNYVYSQTGESFGGAIHNENGTIGDITGDFIGNYVSGDDALAYGGAIYTITDIYNFTSEIGDIKGDFIGNYAESLSDCVRGGVIYNEGTYISSITGDFIGNYAKASTYVKGSVLFNYRTCEIGAITGDFIGNYAIATDGYVVGGVIYSYNGVSLSSFNGDFIANYAQAYSVVEGGIIYSYKADIDEINSNFIGNYAISESSYIKGGIIYNYVDSTIGAIEGDFVGNYAQASSYIYGGVFYNYNADILGITGNFINNYGESTSSNVYGGVIYNVINSATISSITGDFIANYASAASSAYGGVIYNESAIIGDITGNFISNYATSTSTASGGVIYNYKSDIGDISGDFIANYVYGSSAVYAGAIYNYSYSSIGDITGNFIGNYAYSENSSANGGAIFNYVYASIASITGDFIGNYAISESYNAKGGAIYNHDNGKAIGNITGDFIGNYLMAYGSVYGGAIFAASSEAGDGAIVGDFIANYAISENSSAIAGAIYYSSNNYDLISGDFVGNYVSGTYAAAGAVYVYDKYLDSITGNFIANYAQSSYEQAGGGAFFLCGLSATLNNLSGDFVYNYVLSTENQAVGGAVYNLYYATINSIVGDFIGNYAIAYTGAYGGAIYNNEGGEISYLSGNFIGNYATSTTGEAFGGAICNTSMGSERYTTLYPLILSSINIENANFINNYVSGETAYGGAIYNDSTLTYTLQADTYAVATGNTATSAGGFLYNTGDVSFDIASGALFTVGVYAEDDSTDSIYNSGSFVKSGAGTMLIRSTFTNEAYSDSSSGGSISVEAGVLIIEGTDEAQDLDSVWFYSDAVLSAISSASASFVLGTSMNLGEYLIVGTYTGEALENTAYFAADSVFAVHVETTGSTGDYTASSLSSALVGNGSSILAIEEGAVLVIYGASAGTDIRILEDFDGESSDYAKWDIEYISSANPLYEIEVVEWRSEDTAVATIPDTDDDSSGDSSDDGTSAISLEDDNTPSIFAMFSVASINDTTDGDLAVADIASDETDASLGVASIDDSSDGSETSLYLSTGVDEDVVAEVGQIAEIGGVISNMGLLVNLARDTTMARFSVFDEIFYAGNETNFGVWATPMGNYTQARGLNAGTKSTGYDMSFGGGNVGVDYTLGDSCRVGIAFHAGYGETNSVGDFSATNNDFGFYSLTLYNGFKVDNFLIYADVNFAMTDNDLTQYNSLGTGNFYADVDAYAISGEVRVDYLIEINTYQIIPHLGLNYMYLSINDYDVYFSGEAALNVNSKGQSVFAIPVGVSLTKSFYIANDYFFSPILDLGVIFKLGDLYSKSNASFDDIDSTPLSVQSYNDYTFTGLLAFEIKKNNTRMGLSYFIETSENITSHNFRLNFRYDF